jgi:hypothetical protein
MTILRIIRKFGEVLDHIDAICHRYQHILAVFAVIVAAIGGGFAYFQLRASAKAATNSSNIDALRLLHPEVIVVGSKTTLVDGDLYFFVRFRNEGELHAAVSFDYVYSYLDCFGLEKSQRIFHGDIEKPYAEYGIFGPGDEAEFRFILEDFEAEVKSGYSFGVDGYLEFKVLLQPVSYTPTQDFLPQLRNALPDLERYEVIDGRKTLLPKFSYVETISESFSVSFGVGGEILEVNTIKNCSQIPKSLQEKDLVRAVPSLPSTVGP